jgi:hypothetical protein
MEVAKQNAKQRYYQKNKEKYIERVQKQRENKKTTQNNSPPIQNNTSLIQNNPPPIENLSRIVDFITWIINLTYVCVDVRDTTGVYAWGKPKKIIYRKNITTHNETQTDSINPNVDAYINCIKSFLKVGERYVFTIDEVPIFFYIKQIEETNIIITYCKIRFIKYGDGSAEFVPEWNDEMKEMAIDYKTIYNVRPFDEKEKYKYDSYLLIRKDVNSFYGI